MVECLITTLCSIVINLKADYDSIVFRIKMYVLTLISVHAYILLYKKEQKSINFSSFFIFLIKRWNLSFHC